mmetsp:Transcript_21414/g.44036  ORF Transcript_21414/g.44036 Transcript_21414/m.44036 type:complete len:169 (+) Transcript_21414:137-643(+)
MSSLITRFERALVQVVVKHHQGQTVASAASTRYFSDEGPKQRVMKVKKKVKKNTGETGRSRDLELLLAFLDAPKVKAPPADEEETKRRDLVRKNYNIGKFKQHNEENHDIACKLRMKSHAINMLPKQTALKEKALEIDDEYPPRWRTIPAWTPPIPGFNPAVYQSTEE